MIIKTEVLLETAGNISADDEIKMTVNTKNTSKLFSLLLGSYKSIRSSFIREYTSNAWDAHKEINSTEPVIVQIDEDDGGIFIAFIDKGVGMSYEFVKKIFSSLLDSTKEQTNDAIGGFGIGSKSGLGYQKQMQLRTVKDGLLNDYLIYCETSELPVISPVIINEPIDEHSGTTVKIYLKTEKVENANYSGWSKRYIEEDDLIAKTALSELCFFDNVVFDFKTYNSRNHAASFNNSKIIEGTYFKYKTNKQYAEDIHLILGKVCYTVDWRIIGREPINIPIGIKFEIGELMVGMTREFIEYSDDAKKLINERIDLALQELVDKYNEQQQPIEDLFEYTDKKKKFEDSPYHYLKLPNFENLNITALTSILINDKQKYHLNPITYKPIAHLPIKLKKGVNPFWFITPRRIRLEDCREKQSEASILKINKNEFQFFKNKNKELTLDFKKYVKNAVFLQDDYKGFIHKKSNEDKTKHQYNTILYENFCNNLGIHKITDNSIVFNDETRYWKKQSYSDTVEKRHNIYESYPLGTAKVVYEYKRIITEELFKTLNVKDFETFEIPQTWLDEQKAIAKEAYIANKSTRLERVISVKDMILNDRYDLHFVPYTSKHQLKDKTKLTDKFDGIIVYGFQEDRKGLELFTEIIKEYEPYKKEKYKDWYDRTAYRCINVNHQIIRVYQIAKNNLKSLLKTKTKNIYHVSQIMDLKVIQNFFTSVEIKNNHAFNLEADEIKEFNYYLSTVYEEIYKFKEQYPSSIEKTLRELISLYKSNTEILKIEINPIIKEKIDYIDNYFKNAELVRYVKINEDSLPHVVNYLKEKGKKVNINFYHKPDINIGKEKVIPVLDSFELVETEIPLTNYSVRHGEITWTPKPIKLLNSPTQIKNEETEVCLT
jgi:hypothetical protein